MPGWDAGSLASVFSGMELEVRIRFMVLVILRGPGPWNLVGRVICDLN